MKSIMEPSKKEPLLSPDIEASDSGASRRSARRSVSGSGSRSLASASGSRGSAKRSNSISGRATPTGSATGKISPLSIGSGAAPANNDGNSLPPPPPEGAREKKVGHRFFGCCCDSKRAVVWLNTIILMINAFIITYSAVNSDRSADGYTRAMIIRSCGMFVTFTTLLGAYWYSKEIVMVGLCFACYQLTVGISKVAKYDWQSQYNEEGKLETLFPMVWYTLVFYAEAVFIYECYTKTMTAETYKSREKYCCCCNC